MRRGCTSIVAGVPDRGRTGCGPARRSLCHDRRSQCRELVYLDPDGVIRVLDPQTPPATRALRGRLRQAVGATSHWATSTPVAVWNRGGWREWRANRLAVSTQWRRRVLGRADGVINVSLGRAIQHGLPGSRSWSAQAISP